MTYQQVMPVQCNCVLITENHKGGNNSVFSLQLTCPSLFVKDICPLHIWNSRVNSHCNFYHFQFMNCFFLVDIKKNLKKRHLIVPLTFWCSARQIKVSWIFEFRKVKLFLYSVFLYSVLHITPIQFPTELVL